MVTKTPEWYVTNAADDVLKRVREKGLPFKVALWQVANGSGTKVSEIIKELNRRKRVKSENKKRQEEEKARQFGLEL